MRISYALSWLVMSINMQAVSMDNHIVYPGSSWIFLEPCLLNSYSYKADHHRKTYIRAIITHLKRIKFNVCTMPGMAKKEKNKIIETLKEWIDTAEQWVIVIHKIINHSLSKKEQCNSDIYRDDIDCFCLYEFPEYQKELKALIDDLEAQNFRNKDFYVNIQGIKWFEYLQK